MTDQVPGPGRRARGLAWRWGPVLAAAALLGAFVAPTPAFAVMDILQTDDNSQTYCLTSGFTTQPNLAHDAMEVLDSTTEFATPFSGTCSGNRLSSTVDVWWIQMDLTGTIRGEEQCRRVIPGSSNPFLLPYCESADVRIDFVELDKGENDLLDREKTAVHELGHSVGLGHHTHVCAMRSGELGGTNEELRRWHDDDIDMINDNY
jgi:hypothetical protein